MNGYVVVMMFGFFNHSLFSSDINDFFKTLWRDVMHLYEYGL